MTPEFHNYIKGCNLWTLRAMLSVLESRLGTIQERPDDIERVQAVAHQINNLMVGQRGALPAGVRKVQRPKRFGGGCSSMSFEGCRPVSERTG